VTDTSFHRNQCFTIKEKGLWSSQKGWRTSTPIMHWAQSDCLGAGIQKCRRFHSFTHCNNIKVVDNKAILLHNIL